MSTLELEKQKLKLIIICDSELRYNHNHDAKGRFAPSSGSGSGSAKKSKAGSASERKANRDYGKGDTRDALEQIKEGQHNSLEQYMDSNGNLTPERIELHKRIIDSYLEDKTPAEGQAEMLMLGGGSASGKTTALKKGIVKGPDDAVTIDPDDIKKKLPGYKEMAEQTTDAAGYYHEESSMIAKQLANVAFNENYNVIYDGTGDGKVSSVMKKIEGAKAHGYVVNAVYSTVDIPVALERNEKRYQDAKARGENPRRVADDKVIEIHREVSKIAPQVAAKFDKFTLIDNNGELPIIIATGGNGQDITPVNGHNAEVQKFLDKANG